MNRSLPYNILLAGVVLWCTLLLLPPVLATVVPSMPAIANGCYAFFSRICHQFDERSLHLFGHKLGVCGRCTAIYTGFLLGTLLVPYMDSRRWRSAAVWVIASAPMALDVLCDLTGLHASTLATRVVTGSMFGIVAAFLLVPHLVDAISGLFHRTTPTKGVGHEFETR